VTDWNEVEIGIFEASNGEKVHARLILGDKPPLIDFRQSFDKDGIQQMTRKGFRVSVEEFAKMFQVVGNVQEAININKEEA